MDRTAADELPGLVAQLRAVVARLEGLFPGRHFTLDGHLVGSLAEVLAAYIYGLELEPGSTPCHDAQCPLTSRRVQIKGTQRERVALYAEPEHLLVLRFGESGVEEIYNGPGSAPWAACGSLGKNGQRTVSVGRLRTLAASVPFNERLAALCSVAWCGASTKRSRSVRRATPTSI
jgi:hypothetical protein